MVQIRNPAWHLGHQHKISQSLVFRHLQIFQCTREKHGYTIIFIVTFAGFLGGGGHCAIKNRIKLNFKVGEC